MSEEAASAPDGAAESTPLSAILSGQSEAAGSETPTGDKETAETPSAEAKPDADTKAESTEKTDDKAETKAEPEKDGSQPRDDKGRFVPKEEADGLRKALKDERQKRQDLQRKIEEGQEPTEKTDFFEDPEKALDERLSKERAEFNQRFFDMSESLARDRFEDYDEVINAFLETAETDTELAQSAFHQAASARDPAGFLYNFAKQNQELSAVGGDLGKYRESIETPLKTELEAKDKEISDLKSQLAALGKVSPSMNDQQSTSSKVVKDDEANAPTKMDDILKKPNR